eukprot:364908-Chlamydomonas_euryale.AAC.2
MAGRGERQVGNGMRRSSQGFKKARRNHSKPRLRSNQKTSGAPCLGGLAGACHAWTGGGARHAREDGGEAARGYRSQRGLLPHLPPPPFSAYARSFPAPYEAARLTCLPARVALHEAPQLHLLTPFFSHAVLTPSRNPTPTAAVMSTLTFPAATLHIARHPTSCTQAQTALRACSPFTPSPHTSTPHNPHLLPHVHARPTCKVSANTRRGITTSSTSWLE